MTDPGDSLSNTVHIYEGYALHHANLRAAGRDLSEYAMKNLTERRYICTPSADREIARNVKEKLCHIGFDYDTELKSTAEVDKEKTYVFPDETSSLSALNVSIALQYPSIRVSLVKKPADSATLLPVRHEV